MRVSEAMHTRATTIARSHPHHFSHQALDPEHCRQALASRDGGDMMPRRYATDDHAAGIELEA
jgi:hypothetical protein